MGFVDLAKDFAVIGLVAHEVFILLAIPQIINRQFRYKGIRFHWPRLIASNHSDNMWLIKILKQLCLMVNILDYRLGQLLPHRRSQDNVLIAIQQFQLKQILTDFTIIMNMQHLRQIIAETRSEALRLKLIALLMGKQLQHVSLDILLGLASALDHYLSPIVTAPHDA